MLSLLNRSLFTKLWPTPFFNFALHQRILVYYIFYIDILEKLSLPQKVMWRTNQKTCADSRRRLKKIGRINCTVIPKCERYVIYKIRVVFFLICNNCCFARFDYGSRNNDRYGGDLFRSANWTIMEENPYARLFTTRNWWRQLESLGKLVDPPIKAKKDFLK